MHHTITTAAPERMIHLGKINDAYAIADACLRDCWTSFQTRCPEFISENLEIGVDAPDTIISRIVAAIRNATHITVRCHVKEGQHTSQMQYQVIHDARLLDLNASTETLVGGSPPTTKRNVATPCDLPPFRVGLVAVRDKTTMLLTSDGVPALQSDGILRLCHPEKGSFKFWDKSRNLFYSSADYATDQDRWELTGTALKRKGPKMNASFEFQRADDAHTWFEGMRRFAKGKNLLQSTKFHAPVQYPQVPVKWTLCGTGYWRVASGAISCTSWNESLRTCVSESGLS
ncbi:hypothetical protein OBBRIDRAFT_545370 [Obba rivulosa]|uniref:Uncharacterized protein n=1 Tax=Obba rivulosa TaxID=1052685 RepID=A0A8E2AUB2_9APHY|nr:hypothetical protein OBBRIDRAFT_545370 [Obba rivulosa]